MTKEETIEAIKVMQAWVDGEDIEGLVLDEENGRHYRINSEKGCMWNWYQCEYRIKQKDPLEEALNELEESLGNPGPLGVITIDGSRIYRAIDLIKKAMEQRDS